MVHVPRKTRACTGIRRQSVCMPIGSWAWQTSLALRRFEEDVISLLLSIQADTSACKRDSPIRSGDRTAARLAEFHGRARIEESKSFLLIEPREHPLAVVRRDDHRDLDGLIVLRE